MVKVQTRIEARSKFRNLKTLLKTLKPPEVTGISDPSKVQLPQSQVSIQAGKSLH